MTQTGKRHPFRSWYRAGFDAQGQLIGLEARVFSDGGWTTDLSAPVLDRALFHLDNAYFIPHLRFEGRVCCTNLPSNTAFRGFGGPQGMLVVEDAMQRYAERMQLDPAAVRSQNFYEAAPSPRSRHPYGQILRDCRLQRIWGELQESSDYARRRAEIEAFNARSRWLKRGLGFQPVKFGISFTKSLLNQAGALVVVYSDGSVQLNHGGTEMGQGLHNKMMAVCSAELGVARERIRQMPTQTEKVPNTSATAASSGSDLNGQAVAAACRTLRERLEPVAAQHLGVPAERLRFAQGRVWDRDQPAKAMTFDELALQAWLQRVSLSATGFYATPGVDYDHSTGRGTPFFYYAFGGAVVELEVNGLTGEHRLRRADILHDVGDSLSPRIDQGQVEGAFIQGWGWLSCEEVLFREGRLLTHGPSTYKIPSMGTAPEDFRVALLQDAREGRVIGGSKAVGEPPFMLAIAGVHALRHAIAAFGPAGREVELSIPCTPEAVLRALTTQGA